MKILEFFRRTDDAQKIRLELACAYADLGADDLARSLLAEVREEGSRDQRETAETLLAAMA